MPGVRTEKLTKVYRQDSIAVTALKDVDLEIAAGEFVALVGPSGSGKSTLLNMLGGLDRPTSGRLWVADEELGAMSRHALAELRLRKIGFVFQEFNLIPVLSALENVEYVMLLQGVPDAERRARAMAILDEVGLAGLEDRRPGELSGGQQQRVAVARAIVSEPALVLADEPTANLDSATGAALMDLMRKLNEDKGVTFVFSTHDAMGMEGIAGRVSAQPGVAAVAPRIEGEALASGPEKTRGVLVIGVDPAREGGITTLTRAVKAGNYLDAAEPNGILLGDRVAEILRVAVNDEVTLVTQAADGSIGAGRYRVRGIYDSGIDMIDSAYVFLTLPAAQSFYALEGRVTTLAVRLDELGAVPGVSAALAGQLGATFEVLGWQKLLPRLADNVAFHELFTYIILFVVFVVVTLGIANTILMGVMERIREFGVMMALGTAPGQIARVVLYEAALLGLAGVVAGNGIGLGIVAWFGRRGLDLAQYAQAVQMMPGLTGIVYPSARADHLLLLSVLLLATTVAASLYPAWKAAGFTPVEGIRGAPPGPG